MRSLVLVAWLALPTLACAQEFKMEPPKSPADSLKCIKTRPGFKVELMVAEPLVMDPIAFAWGPDGKFWVVEMGDYPLGTDGKGKPGGKIKYLEKSKPDGPYDKMTLFMDGVGFPTGVFPYGKGVLVTCAPDIFYAEVAKDGKAGVKKVLFTGFKEGNQQHRVNGLTWGIDNWIYGANGDSGGIVKSLKTNKEVNISGRDFRFKVETGEFEAVSGQSQFGRCRDDWGNWFGCNNSNPMYHYVLDDQYLKRNPHVLYPDHRVPVSVKPGAAEVFPISKPLPRFNTPQALNHFTSACSTIIYRDTLFGKEFEGNMFVSEPVHNLVHREIMKPKGVTFTSQRADDEQTSEFLASSDNWFRPAMIQVGPDGALWIADMYRYVIEHPEWIPKDWQKKLDLRAGHDLGRIYRVYPDDQKPREIVRMDNMKVEELVKQLESPSGWVRDSAHQLLVERRRADAKEEKKAEGPLEDILKKSRIPQARVHALYCLSGIYPNKTWPATWYEELITDRHPAVRRHAMAAHENSIAALGDNVWDSLAKDPDPQVRQQAAYMLGTFGVRSTKDQQRLVRLLCDDKNDQYLLAAGLSSLPDKSASDKTWSGIVNQVMNHDSVPTQTLVQLLRMSKAVGTPLDSTRLFVHSLSGTQNLPESQQLLYVGDLVALMEKNNVSLKTLLQEIGDKKTEATLLQLKKINRLARAIVADPKSAASEKLIAMRLLGRGIEDDRADHKVLVSFLNPRTPDDIQSAVIQHLSASHDPRAPLLLTQQWKTYSPALRNQVLDALFSRVLWTRMTLDAIKQKEILPQEIDAVRRQRLLQHKDAQVRELAAKLFDAASSPDRGRIVDLYALQLPDKTDVARGAKLFAKACATCHKLGGMGQDVGPDLASVGDKSVQGLLTAILDPNRAVESRYINYTASTKAGLTVNGIMQGETSTTITLVAADGKKHQLLRNEIDELASTGKSLMPDGLEKDLSPQDVADIIAHVRGSLPKPKRKEFPGNSPQTQFPGAHGVFILVPATAAIYGPYLVLEKKYANLGYWHSPDDHAVWTFEVPKTGRYDVWIYFACDEDNAGNKLAFQAGKSRLTHRVASTGSWDTYRGERIGALELSEGRVELTVSSDGPIRGALIDLKKVELSPK